MARGEGKRPTKKGGARKRRPLKRMVISSPLGMESLGTTSTPSAGTAPGIVVTEPIMPPGLKGVAATGSAAPFGLDASAPLTGVAARGIAGSFGTVAESAHAKDETDALVIRGASRSSARTTLYIKPAADSYVVPQALQPALADARTRIMPCLDQIEAIIGRIEPVLVSDRYKRWIGHNRPPGEIDDEHFTYLHAQLALFADKTTRIQLSPDQPSIDREALALAWRTFNSTTKAVASFVGQVTRWIAEGTALALGTGLTSDPANFHQELLNLIANLESAASILGHFLLSCGLPL